MSYHIREATLSDIPVIAPLFDAYRQFYEQPANLPLASHYPTDRLKEGVSVILLAENDQGEALGFCQLYHSYCSVLAAPIFVLYDLFVSPAYRQLSIGKALMQAAETTGRQMGKARLDLTTARDNVNAQALYEQCGYVRDDIFLAYQRTLSA